MCLCVQDELLAELEELEQEELDKNLLEIEGTEDLPSVPSTSLPSKPGTVSHDHITTDHYYVRLHVCSLFAFSVKKKEEEDEDDMADLEAWAAN